MGGGACSIVCVCTSSPNNAAIGNDTSPVKNNDTIELVHVASNKLLNRSVLSPSDG